jgi:hypothetical protein
MLFRTILLAVAVVFLFPVAAKSAACTKRPHDIKGGSILSTMVYYARPGQENTVYQGIMAQNRLLMANHMQSYTVFRGPGGDQPAVVWAMTMPNFKAHDAWLKAGNNIHETPMQMAEDKRLEGATLRVAHYHYILHDGWSQSMCP